MNLPEYIYYLGLSAKRSFSLKNRRRLPFKVISIGNITVGGTGKTPATIALAEEAKKRGFQPVILTRGYKGTAKGPCFVSKGEGPLMGPEEAGDEPCLMAERLRSVPVIKSTDRYEGGMFALQQIMPRDPRVNNKFVIPGHHPLTPIFILDDGFQHWQLHRDRDIVLIDSLDPFGNKHLLPFGRLREPLAELKRADIIVVTKAEREDPGLISQIRKYNMLSPIFFSEHRTVSVRSFSSGIKPLGWLKHRKVFCFCGLADPESFRNTVSAAGAEITGLKAFPDHHSYSQQDMTSVVKECSASGASWLTTTAKDMVKLRSLDLPVNILIIEIEFIANSTFFESVFA